MTPFAYAPYHQYRPSWSRRISASTYLAGAAIWIGLTLAAVEIGEWAALL